MNDATPPPPPAAPHAAAVAPPRRGGGGGVWPDLAAGLFVVALGAVTLWQAGVIPVSPIYAQVGPKAVPYGVGAGLLAIGAGLCVVALRGGWSHDLPEVAEAPPGNWRALGLLGAGLLANLALIDWAGFIVAATAQFVLVAAAFGARPWWRDALIGLAVTVVAYLAFSRVLGVDIGAGALWEGTP